MSSDARATLRELRRTRRLRRLGDTDWYDVAYRVYLFALVGLTLVVWASNAIEGVIGEGVDTDELLTKGPSIIGLFVVLAFALGLRSGANGGPVSVEIPDIRHVLMAPIDRRMVLLVPITQRMRAMVFGLGLIGAVLGQLVATELVGSRTAWALSVGLFGAIVGAMFVSVAVIAHALRLPRWGATLLGAIALAWQGVVAWGIWSDQATGLARVGPANLAGRLALWGISEPAIDVIPIFVAVALVILAIALGGRLRIEPLARRGELVSQLRFAATVQDLRTVVLLRRQLRSETLRNRPWGQRRRPVHPEPSDREPRLATRRERPAKRRLIGGASTSAPARNGSRLPSPSPTAVWRRGFRTLRRLPVSRLTRILSLAIAAGVGAALTVSASPLFALLLLTAAFLLGLESLEPLSQEIDRPDITDSFAIERGWLYANHLLASGVLLAIASLFGAATTAIIDPSYAAAAFAVAIPVAWAAAMGPVVATVLDAPTPLAVAETTLMGTPRNAESSLVPPEFAGFSTAIKTLIPVIVSAVCLLPVFALRYRGDVGTAVRSIVGSVVFVAVVLFWVRRRDPWSVKIREFMAEGRAAT